jgi:polyadenylation factor subunit 2
MKEWVILRGHKKEVCCASYFFFIQVPRPYPSLTLLHQSALAWHPVHPILVSGGSEGAIIHWDLSSPPVGTPAPMFPPATSSTASGTSPSSHTSAAAFSAPAPQIAPRATLSQAHDSNVWALTFHPLGHLLVSASNDHTTRFWARERPGDAASVFGPGGAKPAAAGPDDDADGDQDDEDDALAVPGFGSSASVAGAGSGGAWWNSTDASGGMHGGVGPGADDVVPGFGGGGSGLGGGGNEVPGLGSGGSGFGGGVGGGSGLVANAGGRPNGPSMSAGAAQDGHGPRGGQQGEDWAYRRGGGGGGYEGGGRSAGFGVGRGQRWNGPSGTRRGGRY